MYACSLHVHKPYIKMSDIRSRKKIWYLIDGLIDKEEQGHRVHQKTAAENKDSGAPSDT